MYQVCCGIHLLWPPCVSKRRASIRRPQKNVRCVCTRAIARAVLYNVLARTRMHHSRSPHAHQQANLSPPFALSPHTFGEYRAHSESNGCANFCFESEVSTLRRVMITGGIALTSRHPRIPRLLHRRLGRRREKPESETQGFSSGRAIDSAFFLRLR